MPISLPKERVYYAASPTETDRVLLWIPTSDLERMVANGEVKKEILIDFPGGAEIEISPHSLADYEEQYELKLGIDPNMITQHFQKLSNNGLLPESGLVRAEDLEKYLQEPQMSKGESPQQAFTNLERNETKEE